ncbi:hypothetical protein D3C75_458880 [compost metagenome]
MAYIGFVGYSSSKFNEQEAIKIIDDIFKDLNEKDIIVSGGTSLGIPKLVYEKAKKLNMKTIGIMCKKGFEYDVFPVDQLIVTGVNWGDESEEFLSSIEVLYKIGGGNQSIEEAKKARKMGIDVHEFNLNEIK